jgi:predicted MFS family arabinose efflux permease
MSTHPSTRADNRQGADVSATASVKLPFVVMLLAVGTFLTATTEFVIAGLLPELAADLDVSVARAGLLITAFAVGMIVGAPLIAVATARVPQRSTLVAALLVFSAGHIVAALSSSFAVVLTARIVTALATGTFLAVAAAVAVAAVGAANGARAMGTLMSGVAFATVVGVPLGSFVGHLVGWRGVFWGLAVVSAVAAVGIARLVPHTDRETAPSLREQARVLTQGKLWLVLAATALVTGGFMAAFSFVSPLLTERTGLSDNAVPLVLIGFGVGSLIGTNLAGRFGDRGPLRTFTVIALSSIAVLLLLIPLSTMTVPTIVLVVLLGASGMAVTAIATPLAVRFGHHSPSLAAALAVSAFNVGIAAGSALAGVALESSLGTTGPEIVGVVMVLLGLVPLAALGALRATTHPDDAREPGQVDAPTAELVH